VESSDSDAEDDDDDLFALVRAEPLDISEDEVDRYIESLPEEWVEERDTWYTVGMALSHQYRGGQIGFEKWCEWSKQSTKYKIRTQKGVWKSFKGDKRPITFRSVIAAAQDNVLQQNLPAIRVEEEYDPLMELLGESLPEKVKVNPIADWTSYLARNEDGAPTGCLHNAKLIIENDARTFGVIAFNSFKGNIVLVNEPRLATRDREHVKKQMVQLEGHLWKVKDPVNGRDISDSHAYELRMMVEAPKGQGGYGIKLTDRDLYAAIDVVANKNRYHPIRNYLESCFASRSSREAVQTLFIRYLGCDDTPYHRECAELLMVGAVARIFEPGHKFDFVPILEGLQGKRKSTFVETLSNGWTAQLTLDFQNTNRMIEQIQGAWLVEIAELQGFSKSDANDLKGFVSQKFDKGRLAYKRNAEVFPRQCVFIGTTNEEEYLRDATGGRRFWPITCNLPEDQEIDIDALRAEADSLWGAAVAIYREMRQTCKLPDLPLYIRSEAAKAEAKALQESRRLETVEDSLAGTIQKWLEEPIGTESGFDDLDPDVPAIYRTETCIMQVWTELMGNEPGRLNTAESIKIGRALGRIEGWVRSKHQIRTERFGRQRVYFKGQTRNTSEL
jgi:predicted P-loop ATPase